MTNQFLLTIAIILSTYPVHQNFNWNWDREVHFNTQIETADTSTVALADINGKELSFDEIKNKYKGKIIYVEFWASWCAPCRKLMPSNRKLREALIGKDIVFVYLSIDSKTQLWLKACSEEKLDKYSENYIVLNQKNSEFLKKNLSFVPVAMIFDKTGRLISSNTYPGEENLQNLSKLAQTQ